MNELPNRLFPETWEHPPLPLPADKAVPFGWNALPIPREGLVLRWKPADIRGASSLRFTLAIDSRAARAVEISLAESSRRLGVADVQFGCPLQTYETPLPETAAIFREGLRLRVLDGSEPLWILAGGAGPLLPHIFTAEPDVPPDVLWERCFESLASPASVQIFGWKEGCVLEGLEELARLPAWRERALAAQDAHLDLFFSGNEMRYADPRRRPVTSDGWNNNEHGLMLPALLRRRPDHPAIRQLEEKGRPIFASNSVRSPATSPAKPATPSPIPSRCSRGETGTNPSSIWRSKSCANTGPISQGATRFT